MSGVRPGLRESFGLGRLFLVLGSESEVEGQEQSFGKGTEPDRRGDHQGNVEHIGPGLVPGLVPGQVEVAGGTVLPKFEVGLENAGATAGGAAPGQGPANQAEQPQVLPRKRYPRPAWRWSAAFGTEAWPSMTGTRT